MWAGPGGKELLPSASAAADDDTDLPYQISAEAYTSMYDEQHTYEVQKGAAWQDAGSQDTEHNAGSQMTEQSQENAGSQAIELS